MLDPYQLNETDELIIEFFEETGGRVSPSWIAEEIGASRPYVSQRLKRLQEHGHVESPYRGLWEMIDNPLNNDRQPNTAATENPVTDEHIDQLRNEIPGGDSQTHRIKMILEMYNRLRELGSASKDDLLEVVNPEQIGYKDDNSVWSNIVKGRDTLRALPGVETPPTGRSQWRYTGAED